MIRGFRLMIALVAKHLRPTDPLSTDHDLSHGSAPASLPVRPDTCTSAAYGPRCSIGCSPGNTAGSSSCGSTTPTSSGTSRRRCSRSSTACTGWASTGTRGRKWAGRSLPITSRSGWIAIGRPSKSCWPAAMPTTITPRPRNCKAEREAAEREKRPFRYSRRFMAETPADRARFESEGRQAVVRLKMPTEGTLVLDDLVRGRVEFEWAARAGPRRPADRRHVPLSPGQRGRRSRFPDHARHPRRRAPLEHAAAGVHSRSPRLSAAGLRPSAVRGRAGQPQQAQQAEARQVSEEPRLRPTGRARPEDRRSDRPCRSRPTPSIR